MGLTTGEIRDRAERFWAVVHEESYEARSGRKAWPEFAPLYEAQSILAPSETFPVIEREIAAADGEEERRLRRLLRWAARHHLQATNARLDDEFSYWKATAKVEVGDAAVPVSQVDSLAFSLDDRDARRQVDAARSVTLEEAASLQLDRLSRWREAATELGYGGYRETVERLAGVNLGALLQEARRLVSQTEDLYRESLREALRSRAGVDLEEAESHDAGWLRRMPWMDGSCQERGVLETLRKDLRDIGLPLEVGGHVALDYEEFPGPGMCAFCAPVRIPDRVRLLVTPTITQPGCVALLRAVGRALHYAYTDARLSFEDRALGDMAVVEAYGHLFADLSRSRPWIRRTRRLTGDALADYLRIAAVSDLYSLRQAAGRLEFELELSDNEHPADMGARWAETLRSVTGVRFDSRGYLERLGQRFGVARYLRGRMLAAQLQQALRERFDEDWYRNPLGGPFLGEWLAGGTRLSAAELAARLAHGRLDAEALLDSVRSRLA